MTSETDSVSHQTHVQGRPESSVVESVMDRSSNDEGSGPDGGDRTHAGQGDHHSVSCRRQTQDEFLYAMKEDLGDWLGELYGVDIGAGEFFERLETGVLLCRHAIAVHGRLCRASHDNDEPAEVNDESGSAGLRVSGCRSSKHLLSYHSAARAGSFQARDNISQFIGWCRSSLAVPDTLLFETEDLVARRNERNVLLCLLEVARRGWTQYGIPAPTLVHLEQQIDAELRQADCGTTATATDCRGVADGQEDGTQPELTATGKQRRGPAIEVDWMSLDEMVRVILSECTCSDQFPMIRVAEGKYRIGETQTLVFLRILRKHVMVRIGGGWDTLESYLDRHDPCRCNSKQHRGTQAFVPAVTTLPCSSEIRQGQTLDATEEIRPMSSSSRTENNTDANIELSTKAEDNSVTISDVTTSAASTEMPNAACGASVKRTGGQRKPLVHRSTPNLAAVPEAEVKRSRRPNGTAGVEARATTRSASRGRRATAAHATNEANNRRVTSCTARSVTSRDVSNKVTTTTPIRRSTTPTPVRRSTTPMPPSPSRTPASSRQLATTSSLTTSNKLFRSTGNLTTKSVDKSLSPPACRCLSPPPKRRVSSPPKRRMPPNTACASAAVQSSPRAVARHQPGYANSKPVVISGGGYRAQAHDGGEKNASMRSRMGIAPNLLLPNCYRPGKATPRTVARSVSVDASVTSSSTDIPADSVVAATTSPRIRRSVSVQERQLTPPLQANIQLDNYPEPTPEDKELNSRMEMLFEEYRKVERGLIFADEESSCPHISAGVSTSPIPSPRPPSTTCSKSLAGAAAESVTAGSKRVGQTVGSPRAKSVGNLSVGSSSTQQQRTDRTARETSSSYCGIPMSTSRSLPSASHQKGQSSPGVGRRSIPPPATPPPSRKNAVSGGVTTTLPRQSQHGTAAQAAVYSTVAARPAPADFHRSRSCGVGGLRQVRRDSLSDASRRPLDGGAGAGVDDHSPRVEATPQAKRRSSTPGYSVTASQRAVLRPAEHMVTVSDSNSRVSVESPRGYQTAKADPYSGHSADESATSHTERGRRPRPPTVDARSLIPRPVSCSGRRPPSPRRENRDPPKPERFEPVLGRFDSGVDVAAVGLSPSDDGVGGNGSLEAVVERLSASLESCRLALLADNSGESPACQVQPTAVNTIDLDDDDEYY